MGDEQCGFACFHSPLFCKSWLRHVSYRFVGMVYIQQSGLGADGGTCLFRDVGIVDDKWGWILCATIFVLLLFESHYLQRSFVFPLLMKGRSRMPVAIMAMGIVFNVLNGLMQAGGIFWYAPEGYAEGWTWLMRPLSIIGLVLFFVGMGVNLHSDHVIRHLRKPGDNRHYLPGKGMYRYVTSANYFGELVEWTGFALLTASPAAWVFVWWTAANLVPRADAIHKHYREEFGNEAVGRRKRIIPYIY